MSQGEGPMKDDPHHARPHAPGHAHGHDHDHAHDPDHAHDHDHAHAHAHGGSHDHSAEISLDRKSTCEKLAMCEELRAQAVALFREAQFARAKGKLRTALAFLDYTFGATDEERVREGAVRALATLGAAACALRGDDAREAETLATRALALVPDSTRALFVRGEARARLGDLEGARADLVECARRVPRDGDVAAELTRLARAESRYEWRSRTLARDMFGGE